MRFKPVIIKRTIREHVPSSVAIGKVELLHQCFPKTLSHGNIMKEINKTEKKSDQYGKKQGEQENRSHNGRWGPTVSPGSLLSEAVDEFPS